MIQYAPRGIQRTDMEGKHRARAFLLATSHIMVWMRRQAGVEDFLDFRMGVEMARHCDAVGVVLEHANRQRLDAARNEEAIHGRQACARGALDKIDFLGILWPCKHYRS